MKRILLATAILIPLAGAASAAPGQFALAATMLGLTGAQLVAVSAAIGIAATTVVTISTGAITAAAICASGGC